MTKETVKKIALGFFFVAGLVVPQYAEELRAMAADPEFINAAFFVITAVLAWFTKAPEFKE